ncbi:MAG: DUF1385 domain-containing protein [Lachnospiraceae bacterium]|nr:DUF1385 domain-containing protein [Lachnospiraceae bacterium]
MEQRLPKGTLGGQAVIEGVMMKGKDSYSVAVRKPDQKIEVKLEKYQSYGDRHKFAKVPLIRGVVNFTESMVVGFKTLGYSSSFYEEDEVETKAERVVKDIFKEKAESVIIGLTFLLSVVIAVALFMLLPATIGEFIGKWVESRILLSIIEGVIRLMIFILYVILISQMEDIKRVFMYHGAEHKTINCYESGDELTPENVAKHSRYHKRCGTSFLFVVMVISILVFMLITADQMWLRFVLRLLLIPVIAGISYEFIRLAGRSDGIVVGILSKPGMWIQNLTTKEPDEEMIQVAIISVEAVLYGADYVNAVNQAQGIGAKQASSQTEKAVSKTEEGQTGEVSQTAGTEKRNAQQAETAYEEGQNVQQMETAYEGKLNPQQTETTYGDSLNVIAGPDLFAEAVEEEIEQELISVAGNIFEE